MHLRIKSASNCSKADRSVSGPTVHPYRRFESKAGFSLLELTVFMVIVSIILALHLPRLGGQLTGGSLRSAAQMVGAMGYSAKFRAADTGLPHTLVFDSRENTIQLLLGEKGKPLISKGFTGGISMENMSLEGREVGDLLQVTFYPQGTATGAEITLSGGRDDSLVLTVYAADGAVHAQKP